MKELSIEEKAKAYDEALERMKSWVRGEHPECFTEAPKAAEFIFPQLKEESEDERIRKALITFFQRFPYTNLYDEGLNAKDILAWLEKQGEQKSFDYENANIQQKDFAPKSAMEAIKEEKIDNTNKVEPKDYSSIDPHFFKTTDKVETKFKVGDFIVNDYCSGKVVKITDDAYLLDTGQDIPFSCEHNVHLWNVTKDAKEGDVLFHSDSASNGIFIFKEIIDKGFAKEVICYCDYDSEDHFCLGEHHTCCWADAKILHPATKEQRDTLEKAMTDAGYIFDFESKELKKLGQSEVTKMTDQEEIAEIPFGAKDSELQEATYFIPKGFHAEIDDDKVVIKKGEKPIAWSEEDNMMIEETLYFLREYQHSNRCKNENGMQNSVTCEEWLKSLKPQSTWKPSDEQMITLRHVISGCSYDIEPLVELETKLKEL